MSPDFIGCEKEDQENQMEKESDKTITKKICSLMELFKNAKFIALNIMVLMILGFALVSGNGKKIVLSFYENITGHKFETFSLIEDFSNETYIILKDKLLRDKNIRIEDVDVTIFKESDAFHKYRVVLNKEVFLYKVDKKSNGTWQIRQEK